MAVDERQQPQGPDQQELEIHQERGFASLDSVADELPDPCRNENRQGDYP